MKAIPRYELTKEGQKALNAEVNRQLINHAEKHGCNNDAQVLLTLHLQANIYHITLLKIVLFIQAPTITIQL